MLENRPEPVLNADPQTRRPVVILVETMLAATVLILEDESQLRDVLVRSLRAEGYDAGGVATAHELIERISSPEQAPDLLVIDIGLPDADGRDVCQALRARGVETPVLFLTARDALTDRLAGFSAGGDDYVTKPFDIEEVSVRLQALLRRAGGDAPPMAAGMQFDPTEHTVAQRDVRLTLTPTEFRLLAALAARHGRACVRLELTRAAWPYGAIVHDNTLDVYIARLRRKLGSLPQPPQIITVHGTGYRLE
jgi:two-component system response regulator MprA